MTTVPRRRKLAGARVQKNDRGIIDWRDGEKVAASAGLRLGLLSAAHRETRARGWGQQASTRLSGGPGNVELACAIPGTAAAGSPR